MTEEWSFKKELARKFIHLLAVIYLVIYILVSDMFDSQIALLVLVFMLIILIELEYFRMEIGMKIPIMSTIWKYVRREKEREVLGGDIFFLLGAIIVLAIFDIKIAIAAILMTVFGDMAAALVGKRYGKHYLPRLKSKAWEGIAAEFFVDIIVGIIVMFWLQWGNLAVMLDLKTWLIVFAMALTATIVETKVSKIDDNLIVPVFSGFIGQIILKFVEFA